LKSWKLAAGVCLSDYLTPARRVHVWRIDGDGREQVRDLTAAEEPLDVRLHGESFAIVMRTPGDDRALAAGFLFAERVILDAADIGAVEHCTHPDQDDLHNVVDVFLRGEAAGRAREHLARRRRVTANSSCGVCGRTSIDDLSADLQPLAARGTVSVPLIASLPARLLETQDTFGDTGGLHGAALFTFDGTLLGAAEDVGRHNAVDKIVGRMLLDERPIGDAVLMVSGRVSFEIVQKAWLAGIPVVAAVSAPTSLAVDLARTAGITLLGFVRPPGFNAYTHENRIAPGR
jgi:FdhD protein